MLLLLATHQGHRRDAICIAAAYLFFELCIRLHFAAVIIAAVATRGGANCIAAYLFFELVVHPVAFCSSYYCSRRNPWRSQLHSSISIF